MLYFQAGSRSRETGGWVDLNPGPETLGFMWVMTRLVKLFVFKKLVSLSSLEYICR
jgi:hypothetical protein